MKKISRLIAIAGAALMSAATMVAFAGCDTGYPEVSITYKFRDKEYVVEYTLTRDGAPQTVQHFLELADAGYYDGTVIHNYESSGQILYGGGYVLDSYGELEEKDYWTEVKRLEEQKGITFTQSVFYEGTENGLYTVRGEFSSNGVEKNNKSYRQNTRGTLVMYYMNKGEDSTRVSTVRNNGEVQDGDYYRLNSATSLFYTVTVSGSSTVHSDNDYCAFGITKDFEKLQELLDAIDEYVDTLDENNPFTIDRDIVLNQHDPFESVVNGRLTETYSIPTEPITIVSVKVNKY